MEKFSKFLAARLALRRQGAEAHPDADLLTAFAERRLEKDERATVLKHFASCADCREVAALVAGESGTVETARDVKFGWWHLQWAAGLAAACVVTMVVWRSGKTAAPAVINEIKTASATPVSGVIEKRSEPVKKKVRARTPVPASKPLAPAQDEIQISRAVPLAPLPLARSFDQAEAAKQSAGLATNAKPEPSMAFQRFNARRSQSLWGIDSGSGMLRRSGDGGRSWTPVLVSGDTIFLSLAFSGNEIWAGGEGGALFHSLDDGLHWKAVPVVNGEERVKAGITGIQAEGGSLKVTTKLGVWTSSDAGVSWRPE
jgi:hypothetical protein